MALKPTVKIILYMLCVVLAATACNTSGCLDNQSAIPLAGFYSSSTEKSISLSTLEISGVGVPADSVLVPSGKAVSTVYLPMRPLDTVTAWCLHYTQEGLDAPSFNDTIRFEYVSEPYFASEECGAMYYYHISDIAYTRHLIDRVEVTDSLITNRDIERIHIYFRTSDEETE